MRNPFRRRLEPQTAASKPLQPGWQRVARRLHQPWWQRAEHFSTENGAVRFACGVVADAASRCTLNVEYQPDPRVDEWVVAEDDFAPTDLLATYKGRHQNQRELVRQHIWLYQTLGEAEQIYEPDGRGLSWSIHSPLAVEWKAEDVLIRDAPGGTERDGLARLIPLKQVRRMWVPDETWPAQATSPLRGVLKDCERYESLLRRTQLIADSALMMRGAVWTPDEAHADLGRGVVGGDEGPGTTLERDYMAQAKRQFENGDSVEAIAPVMWRWSYKYGPPIPLDFAMKFDEHGPTYRNEALEDIARGLNYPSRLLVDGGKDSNHWGMWLLDEQFAKNGVAPVLERVCWGDISETFLRPGLRILNAKGIWEGEPSRYRVGFDMTPVVVHPDQSKMAIQLYNIGALSDSALLRIAGFDGTDAPNQAELGRWIMRTQIQRESIRAQQNPGDSLPSDASSVIEQTPATQPGDPAAPATAALDVPSRVLTSVAVGPYPDETVGWLD